jgi:SRSO17 transposase
LSIANHHPSLPVGYRLYLPKEWAEDPARRDKAGVPEEVVFKTKPAIALDQVQAACAAGIARGVVVMMDTAYGSDTKLRTGVSALALSYVAGIQSAVTVWPPGCEPLPPRSSASAEHRIDLHLLADAIALDVRQWPWP